MNKFEQLEDRTCEVAGEDTPLTLLKGTIWEIAFENEPIEINGVKLLPTLKAILLTGPIYRTADPYNEKEFKLLS